MQLLHKRHDLMLVQYNYHMFDMAMSAVTTEFKQNVQVTQTALLANYLITTSIPW